MNWFKKNIEELIRHTHKLDCRTPHLFSIITLLFLIQLKVFAQNSNITFEHFSIAQGMSGGSIRCIYQDSIGYLWFGTFEGLDRYDGYSFKSYTHDPEDTASLVNAFVNAFCEDREGDFWVGTEGGLEKLDRTTGKFTHYVRHPRSSVTDRSNSILSIHEDKYGVLWIGTHDGLNIFDRSNGKFTLLRDDSTDLSGFNYGSIRPIHEDKAGSLWVATGRGLSRFDKKSGRFIHYWHKFMAKDSWCDWIFSIYEDDSGILWLGGDAGLVAFDQSTGSFTQYRHNPKDSRSISSNKVTSISEDKDGNLWIGTYNHGLNVFDKKTKCFTRYVHKEKDPGSLSSNGIMSVFYERSGTIWVATIDKGINKLNRVKSPFTGYPYDDQAPNTVYPQVLPDNADKLWVHASNEWKKFDPKTGTFLRQPLDKDSYPLLDDWAGNLWIGKESGGLFKRDPHERITSFHDSSGVRFNGVVYCFIEAHDGRFWMGTEDGSFFTIDPATQSVRLVQWVGSQINNIYEDASGLLWLGTWADGLLCYDSKRKASVRYSYDPRNPASLNANLISSVYEDKAGTLWVGAQHGLDRFDQSVGTFTHFTVKDGLPSDAVVKIMEDDHGNLWLGTGKGISRFDPKTKRFKNYDVSYGIRAQSGCRTKNGEMYFGGKGLTRFHPDSIQDNPYVPPIVVTQFRLFEKPAPFSKVVDLSYRDNFISFEFAALNYVSTENNQYAYKMEGVDKDWIYSGTRRYASYPNLDPGKYIFKVKGSNNDGVWNEAGTSITIIISPPFWKTWWAYLSYAGFFIFALYAIRRYEMNRISYKNQVKVDKAVLIEKEETDKIKSRFFANISHEFRTPLTLILGPAEKIISDTSDDIKKDANIIKRNSRRLLQLINQLLDLSKLEAGKLKLEASKGNIVSFVKGVALSFESLAESKDITLKLLPEKDFIELYFNREKMMKILTNLLSNAFKFTPEEGMVTVSITESHAEFISASSTKWEIPKSPLSGIPLTAGQVRDDNIKGFVEIKIRDTGIGIAQEETPKLFDRFYQVDSSFTKEHEGTGIGLALTKELIELHHGKINVESKIADPDNPLKADGTSWTEFMVTLPLGSSHLKEDEIIKIEKAEVSILPIEREVYTSSLSKTAADSIAITINDEVIKDQLEEKTIILVVEDNYDMREYIKESLGNGYRIEEAVNGEQGVRKAEKIIPDLIISDMMMPKMDGNELTRILKNDEKTSHIPIILLTARSGQENKIEGLETGADDYLTKPFDIKELQARIENLINIRKKLQAKYSKLEYVLMPNGKKGTSLDEQFIIKVKEVIDKHISEEDFSIEEFGSEVGMSRTQFHRKIKAITGKPASMFLRSIRLARAKKMIEEQHGNISEIAFSVGFSTPSYFTKCFKEEFGYVPSDLND